MTLVIRDFKRGDQAVVRSMIQGGMVERWGDAYDPSANPDTDDLHASYLEPGGDILVAVDDDDHPIGVGVLIRQADGLGRLVRMSVDADHRRQGVAIALVDALVARARGYGFHAVLVTTDTPWVDAVALYQQAGFTVTSVDGIPVEPVAGDGEGPSYASPDVTELWMDLTWSDDTIPTERLELRVPTRADNTFVAELLTDAATRTYLGGPASFAVVEWIKSHSLAPQWGSFIVWLNDEPQRIGMVELDDWRGELEISCHLLPEYWSQGFASEASAAALEWAWANTEVDTIIAVSRSDNRAAHRTLERLGFVYDTELVEHGEPHHQLRINRPRPT